jgi:hypothetical protein
VKADRKIRETTFVGVLIAPRNTLGLAAIVAVACVLGASIQLLVPMSYWTSLLAVIVSIVVSPLVLTGCRAAFSATATTQVRKAPFGVTLKVLELVESPKYMDRVFEPIAADFTELYFRKLTEGQIWVARWYRLSGYYNFLIALAMSIYYKLRPKETSR